MADTGVRTERLEVIVDPARHRYPPPDRRLLRTYGFDPMYTRMTGRELLLSVPFEDLEPGPCGRLIRVVDYDGGAEVYYAPVDLNDPYLLAQHGLRPTEGDPQPRICTSSSRSPSRADDPRADMNPPQVAPGRYRVPV